MSPLEGSLAVSSAATAPAYEGVLYNVFQQLRQLAQERVTAAGGTANLGLVFAFTSANSGEGVTHTISALLAGLARDARTRTLLVDSRHLRNLTLPPSSLRSLWRPLWHSVDAPVWKLVDPAQTDGVMQGPKSWDSSWEYRRDTLDQLRRSFDYILIDCPALREASDILSLAPFADGIILVIEADRTRKEQVVNAEKSINFARGSCLGTSSTSAAMLSRNGCTGGCDHAPEHYNYRPIWGAVGVLPDACLRRVCTAAIIGFYRAASIRPATAANWAARALA